ncbi:MAG: transcription antitermination factor NusB [Deltaproteobacteria bacterium]|nr:transcription antitermination factor NusB [Deltaproteobacteria bacterium]
MRSRSKSREAALKALYSLELSKEVSGDGASELAEKTLLSVDPDNPLKKGVLEYAVLIVEGVITELDELDKLIEECSTNWSVDRMAVVDKNILRLAASELRQTDTPYKVVMDEAIELSKKYGTDESRSFINGVLDKLVKIVK